MKIVDSYPSNPKDEHQLTAWLNPILSFADCYPFNRSIILCIAPPLPARGSSSSAPSLFCPTTSCFGFLQSRLLNKPPLGGSRPRLVPVPNPFVARRVLFDLLSRLRHSKRLRQSALLRDRGLLAALNVGNQDGGADGGLHLSKAIAGAVEEAAERRERGGRGGVKLFSPAQRRTAHSPPEDEEGRERSRLVERAIQEWRDSCDERDWRETSWEGEGALTRSGAVERPGSGPGGGRDFMDFVDFLDREEEESKMQKRLKQATGAGQQHAEGRRTAAEGGNYMTFW